MSRPTAGDDALQLSDEYADGERYDAEFGGLDEDGAFFLALALGEGPCVLDLGCGTGRLAVPLAEAGKQVTGLDGSAAMLAQARRKSAALKTAWPIRWVAGDFRDYDLGQNFDTALACAHAFQGLLTADDQRRFLACARRHLVAGGVFAFDTRNTAPVHLAVDGREHYWHSYRMPDGRFVDSSTIDRYDAATGIMDYRVIRRDRTSGVRSETTIDIKFTEPAVLERLLRAAGFAVQAMFGGFVEEPLTPTSPEIVVVARAV